MSNDPNLSQSPPYNVANHIPFLAFNQLSLYHWKSPGNQCKLITGKQNKLMEMIEIFKTNVMKENQAHLIQDLIYRTLPGYSATFDLEDCDKVLRVKSVTREICAKSLINLLANFGYQAEILHNEVPSTTSFPIHSVSAFY